MRHLLSALLTVTLAVTATGCSGATPPGPPSSVPGTTTVPATTVPAPGPVTAPIAIKAYFAYHEKVQPAARTAPAGTKAVLRAALEALLAGPTASERAVGLSTAVPKGTRLRGVTLAANVAIIDFDSTFASGGGTLSMTDRLAQVVYTATQFPGVDAVTFKIDGKVIKTLGGEGIIVDRPRTRKSCEGETPAILIDQPAWRGTLRDGDTISGTANVFEATFLIEVRDAAGTLVFSRTVNATSGTGTRGTWTVTPTIADAEPGVGSIRVFEPSAKDGTATNAVKIPVILEP